MPCTMATAYLLLDTGTTRGTRGYYTGYQGRANPMSCTMAIAYLLLDTIRVSSKGRFRATWTCGGWLPLREPSGAEVRQNGRKRPKTCIGRLGILCIRRVLGIIGIRGVLGVLGIGGVLGVVGIRGVLGVLLVRGVLNICPNRPPKVRSTLPKPRGPLLNSSISGDYRALGDS